MNESYAKSIASRVASGELQIIEEFSGEFSWLSNFYQHYSMTTTVEHEFQAAKYGSGTIGYKNVMLCKSPGAAKRLGRAAKLPSDWDTRRIHVMKAALLKKFAAEPMRSWLIATGHIPLVEGNYWHDNIWGNCTCKRCESIPGLNMLGLLLMEVRSNLQQQKEG
jgi:ribA/ribD-fused uncharacterized protein